MLAGIKTDAEQFPGMHLVVISECYSGRSHHSLTSTTSRSIYMNLLVYHVHTMFSIMYTTGIYYGTHTVHSTVVKIKEMICNKIFPMNNQTKAAVGSNFSFKYEN